MLWVLRFHINRYRGKFLKIFLSQTIRAIAFIFGILHYLVALYQNTSNDGPGLEISPRILGFHIEIQKEIFKNLLVPNREGYSFDIWSVASSI